MPEGAGALEELLRRERITVLLQHLPQMVAGLALPLPAGVGQEATALRAIFVVVCERIRPQRAVHRNHVPFRVGVGVVVRYLAAGKVNPRQRIGVRRIIGALLFSAAGSPQVNSFFLPDTFCIAAAPPKTQA